MKIDHFRHVALSSPAFEKSVAFYGDVWGLEVVAAEGQAAYLGGLATEHHVLELHRGERKGIDHLSMALATRAEVDAAAEEMKDAGVGIVSEPEEVRRPGGGYGFRIADPEGRVIEFSADVEERPQAIREPVDSVKPLKVSHVVLNTTDIDAMHDFYTEVLGMRVSDWSEHQMVFLRCNQEHHNIAFNQAEWPSLNHVAYEVCDIDAVMRGMGRMKRAGHEPLWGPGRHGPGNMVFCYFQDPNGYVIEFTSEVMRVDESTWQASIHERRPELMDQWGTSGPPLPRAREAMAGEPDPGPVSSRHG